MAADPRRRDAPDGANLRIGNRTEDEHVAVGQILPFCPPPSWYVSYWYGGADEGRSARLARRARGFAEWAIMAARNLQRRRHMPGAARSSIFLSTGKK